MAADEERIRALEELELMRKQLVADAEAIAAVEEDARRAGVPPKPCTAI